MFKIDIFINTKEGPVKTKGAVESWNPANENYLIPDRSVLDRWRDTYIVGNAKHPSTYMFTSLGCPLIIYDL